MLISAAIEGVYTVCWLIWFFILINDSSTNTATNIVFHELGKSCSLSACVLLPSSLSTSYSTQNNHSLECCYFYKLR